jgi:hypothetical protein
MNRYAVISSNSNLDYAPFLPLTTLFWRSIGYETICLLTADLMQQSNKGVLGYIVNHLRNQPGVIIHSVSNVADFKSSTMAQTSRLVAAAAVSNDDSYLLTGDVDMFPLSTRYFNQQDFKKDFHVFSADVYGSPLERHFQMCYLGGTRKIWKSLMGIGDGCLDDELVGLLKGWKDNWCLDEAILAGKMKVWSSFDSCQLLSRGYSPGGYAPLRLDRGYWHLPTDLSTLIDCHSARPLMANWKTIECLVDRFLPVDLRSMAKTYAASLAGAFKVD